MNRWLRKLNNEQKQAVETTEGPLLVLAGAGSGKTRVITHRVAYLLDLGVNPREILGLTFTNKAAEEMRERLRGMVGPEAASKVTLSTFHSLGLMMLKVDAKAEKQKKRYTIFDTGDQLGVLKDLTRALNFDKSYDLGSILSRISHWKNEFYLKASDIPPSDDPYDFAASELYERYQTQLKAYSAVDFDDLVCVPARRLSEDENNRKKWQKRFRYILVDEYQDTNGAQMRLLKGLADENQNVCAVGDDDQAIYGWRGADVKHILRFSKDFENAKIIYLQRNYRSIGEVLDLANDVIVKNPHRHDKRLIATREKGPKPRLCVAPDGDAEASWVGEEIRKEIAAGRRAGDIAVLFRSNILGRAIESELRGHGVNYRILGGQGFYERKEVKDLISYLRLAQFPGDELALRRVINFPPRGIGIKTIEKLSSFSIRTNVSFHKALLNAEIALSDDERAVKAVKAFCAVMTKSRQRLNPSGRNALSGELVSGLRELIVDIELEEELRKSSTSEGVFAKRWAGVEAFVYSFKAFLERVPNATLGDFLERVALNNDDEEEEDTNNMVTLSTLHGSKGLEFPLVFLIGLEEGFLPHNRILNPQENDMTGGDLAEERRLFYVGITRAKDELVLTRASHRILRGKPEPRTQTRFLDDIDELSRFEIEDLTAAPESDQVADMMADLRAMLS